MRHDMSPWREVVVLVEAEFDALERVRNGGIQLYDGRCSAVAAKAVSDLLARGFLFVDSSHRLSITDFGAAVCASLKGTPGEVFFRGKSQRVYTLGPLLASPRQVG